MRMGANASQPQPNSSAGVGGDPIPGDLPHVSYTEKVLEEKELQLKKYIQENYSKIRDVEREFEKLTLELKLTAGPKKAALEHLRKKIELSTEKIKVARQKEEQARKVWEEAKKDLEEQEAQKQRICEDLNSLVKESAAAQYSRLEDLKTRLEALNPEEKKESTKMGPVAPNNVKNTSSSEQLNESETGDSVTSTNSHSLPDHSSNTGHTKHSSEKKGIDKSDSNDQGQSIKSGSERQPSHIIKGRTNNVNRGKGNLVLQKPKDETASGWTGAGFDIDARR
ncbi:hypothetical protein SUGI_0722090 [Cryptomeria japonica]|uniref:uncharacterized protein LOC131046697 n=1 Tax=Cryptomeria japonica TaxID=3369 RepID=UPI0024149B37|nr:uncharacterized protein LOC131046697 [Cryptomeria japonica]GLJ36001.1 hypothetical protein SUGI_0722090 [Cryptomeria japonica]